MNELSTVLTTILSTLLPLICGGGWLYRRQNKKLKEAEVMLAEVNVDKGRIEAKEQESDRLLKQIDHQQSTIDKLTERNEKLVQMNAEKEDRHQQDIKDWEDRFTNQTNFLRGVQRELLSKTQAEIDHAKRESELERERDFYKMWFCQREFGDEKCDPEKCGRRKPKQLVPIKYIPLEENKAVTVNINN